MAETRLPREVAARAVVGRTFRKELRDLDQLFRLALSIVGRGTITISNRRGLNPPVVRVVLGLYVKGCKTARAIRILAAAGLPEDTFILARSLFETSVAVLFILQRTPRLRAQMYIGHISLRTKKALNAWKQTPGLKRQVTKKMMAAVDQGVHEATQILGPTVVASLKAGYSGMNLETTVAKLGGAKTYQVFYRHASSFSHVSDLSEHLAFTPQGMPMLKLTPGPAPTMRQALVMSYVILWTTLKRIDARLGLGHATQIAALRPR
jgi:hypothetical protein